MPQKKSWLRRIRVSFVVKRCGLGTQKILVLLIVPVPRSYRVAILYTSVVSRVGLSVNRCARPAEAL
jgi:hypothetical protein